ncbi:MAG: TonB-dependent receptor plug domain-containing protein, partial [Brevundimonas sp.]
MTSTLLASSPVLADNPIAEPQATTVSDIIVTASATGVDVRDAPASVSVITREEIERQPIQSLGELLGRLPGVTGGVSPTGAMSKITIRGLPDNYTLVLVDGRRVGNSRDISYRPDLGRQDLNWISPDMIERIEVVRGPMSSLYGSDAMGGVINIITRKIAPTWRGSANTSYTWSEESERGDAYQLGVNVAGPITENLGLRLGATYARTNPDEVNIAGANGTGGVVNKSLNGVLNWAPLDNQNFSFEANYGVEEP